MLSRTSIFCILKRTSILRILKRTSILSILKPTSILSILKLKLHAGEGQHLAPIIGLLRDFLSECGSGS